MEAIKRLTSLFLALAMSLSLLSANVWATEMNPEEQSQSADSGEIISSDEQSADGEQCQEAVEDEIRPEEDTTQAVVQPETEAETENFQETGEAEPIRQEDSSPQENEETALEEPEDAEEEDTHQDTTQDESDAPKEERESSETAAEISQQETVFPFELPTDSVALVDISPSSTNICWANQTEGVKAVDGTFYAENVLRTDGSSKWPDEGSCVLPLNRRFSTFSGRLVTGDSPTVWNSHTGSSVSDNFYLYNDDNGELLYSFKGLSRDNSGIDFSVNVSGIQNLRVTTSNSGRYNFGFYFIVNGVFTWDDAVVLSADKADLSMGKTLQLTAQVHGTTESVAWSSSNEAVATVENGLIRAINPGECTITARAGDLSAQCQITVKNVTIKVDDTDYWMVAGKSYKPVVVTVEGTDDPVQWSSTNSTVASVSENGNISTNQSGECDIIAQVAGQQAVCHLTVTSSVKCGDNVYWYYNSGKKTLSLYGSGKTYSYTTISKFPWSKYRKVIRKVEVDDGITSVGSHLFADCTALKTAILPGSITLIEKYAFARCKKLNDVFFKGSPHYTYYEKTSFKDCRPREFYTFKSTKKCKYSSMVGVWDGKDTKSAKLLLNKCGKKAYWEFVPSSGTLTISGEGAMYNYYDDKYFPPPWHEVNNSFDELIKTIIIKKGITNIPGLAFCDTMWVKGSSISIPNTVTIIGNSAFEGVGLRTTINIPGSVKTLGHSLFFLSEAPTVKLHEGLSTIKADALSGAGNKNLTIPSTVKSIGNGALPFKAKTITFTGNAPKLSNKTFAISDDEGDYTPMKLTVYYPKGNKTWNSVIKKQYGGKVKWVAKKITAQKAKVKATALSSVASSAPGTITVQWKKNTTGKGYQIQCSTDKTFKSGVKAVKTSKNATVKTTIKNLKKGTYYVRIRTISGKTYSDWSKARAVKIK